MKTLILTAALPLLACIARAQDSPQPKDAPAETVKKAHPAAWLGISMAESGEKVVIGQVAPGSPAEKAGLKDGDRILRIGDTAVEGQVQRVIEKVGQQKPGDTIELRYLRGDKEETAKIELGERPAPTDGDFRGEFQKEPKQRVPGVRGKILDARGKTLEETKRAIEDVKEEMKKEADQLRLKYKKMESIERTAEDAKKKLEDKIELDPFKDRSHPDLSLETPQKGEADGGKLFRYYFDKEWRADKADGNWDEPELRLGFGTPLFELKKGQKPGGVKFLELRKKSSADSEEAIWKRVQESIAHSLKQSDIGPDMVEKVMKAVEEARRAGSEKEARRTQLEAEAAKLEKEMQSLKERTDKVRQELKKATE